MLRVEPLKCCLFGVTLPDLSADLGCLLDVSHARTHVRVSGSDAVTCLNRHLPIDLRDNTCPVGSVISTALHHVAITVWRSNQGFELFLPRGFAVSCWEIFLETAEQFGVEPLEEGVGLRDTQLTLRGHVQGVPVLSPLRRLQPL